MAIAKAEKDMDKISVESFFGCSFL
jgi:hypothetical protein